MPYVNALNKYFGISMAYGFLHALPRAYNLKHQYIYDKPVDALVVDKLAYCASKAGCSPVLWPFYVVSDMRAVELFARGKSKDDYPAFEFD
jgi:hypothetical protein